MIEIIIVVQSKISNIPNATENSRRKIRYQMAKLKVKDHQTNCNFYIPDMVHAFLYGENLYIKPDFMEIIGKTVKN